MLRISNIIAPLFFTLSFMFSFVSLGKPVASGNSSGKVLLIQESNNSGFTGASGMYSDKCSIFADRVLIEHRLGSRNIIESHSIQNGGSLRALILEAFKELDFSSEERLMCDGPSSSIRAFPNGLKGQQLLMYTSGGCGSPMLRRRGTASYLLLSFAQKICGKPF